MVSVHDVAKFILSERGEMTAMKLQKLLYYSQAWSLVWDEAPLFREKIKAWANGPVVREAYDVHRGSFKVSSWPSGRINALTQKQKTTVRNVLKFYGGKTAQWLSDLTHQEAPWNEARKGLPEAERGDSEITLASMHEYYSSLRNKSKAA
jgi:uncharacterized phage-associated protein